jgi:hypothetical protein
LTLPAPRGREGGQEARLYRSCGRTDTIVGMRASIFCRRVVVLGISAVVLLWASWVAAQEWSYLGSVMAGRQFDAVVGPDDRIHVISSGYVELDADGTTLDSAAVADDRQGDLDFPPAIALGDDGSVHVVTRHGGNFDDGHDIRYRRRNAAGTWDRDYTVGSPVTRNYVVGVGWASDTDVVLFSSAGGSNVWGDLRLWSAGASSATALGDLAGIWRADCDGRLRAYAGRYYLVSGQPDPDGTAHALFADAGGGVRDALAASQQDHQAGTGRRGFADLSIDAAGAIHLIYGAEQTLFYNRYDSSGQQAFASDVQVFAGLGSWHLSSGLGAIAASDDGAKMVAVALRSDGSQQAADSDLLWAYSVDGGSTWSTPEDTGRNTDGGEGRLRPRLVWVEGRFALLFAENGVAGISMATLELLIDGDQDGYTDDVDCDDEDDSVHPGAPEQCNGVDDDCDGDIDEECPCDDGDTRACGSDLGECSPGVETCANQQWGSCQGAVEPTTEICDGLDNDCDGDVDELCSNSPGPEANEDSDQDGGCGCRSHGRAGTFGGPVLAIGLLLALMRRCRRRSPSPGSSGAARPRGLAR